MMRYQRVSPDCLSLPNGRKPSSIRACKDDEPDSGGRISSYAHFDAKPLRVRSGSASVPGSANSTSAAASTTQTLDHFSHFPATSDSLPPETGKPHSNHEINGRCSATGEVVLQWGHNKRSRGSRAENRTVGDESSVHSRQMVKVQRRAAIAGAEKIAAAAAAAAMPPPCGGGYTRGTNLRPCMTSRDSTVSYHSSRNNAEERSVGQQSRSDRRSPTSSPSKQQQQILHHHQHHNINSNHNVAAAAANGFGSDPSSSMNPESKQPSDQETGGSGGAAEKLNLDQFEWPRIYISLSRKEKEDDFLAMKGTKLPQRPKKRPKNVDKALQFCFPGMWLSELTRGRYEVREKKCVKKKCRGLKGMENMDSDSE